jgi:hypothetical protein
MQQVDARARRPKFEGEQMASVVGLLKRPKLRRGCWHCWLQAQHLQQVKLLLLGVLLLGVLQAELVICCSQ